MPTSPLCLPCRRHDAAAALCTQGLFFAFSLLTIPPQPNHNNAPPTLTPCSTGHRRCLVRGQPTGATLFQAINCRQYLCSALALPRRKLARNLQVPLAHIPHDLTTRGATQTHEQERCPDRDRPAGGGSLSRWERRWLSLGVEHAELLAGGSCTCCFSHCCLVSVHT